MLRREKQMMCNSPGRLLSDEKRVPAIEVI